MLPGANPNPKCSLEVSRRPPIKRSPGPPQIVVCMPIGAKEEELVFDVPACSNPKCSCEFHGQSMARPVRNQGLVPFELLMNHMQLVVPLNTTIGYLAEKGKLSGPARNEMTIRALELEAKYIFYWDDDVILPAQTLYTMHNMLERYPDIGLITGVVCTRETPTEPMVYLKHGKGAWWDFSIDPDDPPQDIFAAGGGCIMARTDAIRRMSQPYWADVKGAGNDPNKEGNSTWGHDIYFISKMGRESGYRTCVKGSILCGHWDVAQQKMFELPKDAPPFRKHKPPPSPIYNVEESPALSPEYVDQQLKVSQSDRRLFLIRKELQPKSQVKKALEPFFDQVRVLSVDSRWLAVGEGLKDGWNQPVKRNTPSKGEDNGGNNRRRARSKHRGVRSGGTSKRSNPSPLD